MMGLARGRPGIPAGWRGPLIVTFTLLAGCGGGASEASNRVELLAPVALAEALSSADPALAVDPVSGDLLVSWVAEEEGVLNLYFGRSIDGGNSFATVSRVNHVPGNVNSHAEGAPRIVAAPGLVALTWNNRIENPARAWGANDLLFARSTDGGSTWSREIPLQDPVELEALPPREHGFHGAAWGGDSTLVVAWIDFRENDQRRIERAVRAGVDRDEAMSNPEAFADPGDPRDDDGTLYAAVSHDFGGSWLHSNLRLQGGTCPCCRVTLDRAPGGEVVGSWRGHLDGGLRDPVVATLYRPDGSPADPPAPVHQDNWVYAGCPHSGPALDIDSEGVAHASWYTGAESARGVHYARRAPGASSFSAPVPIAVGELVGVAQPSVTGLPDGGAVVAHNVDAEGRRVIVLSRISGGGEVLGQYEIPGTDGGTHPQITLLPDGRVIVAWTESSGGVSSVRLARFTAMEEG